MSPWIQAYEIDHPLVIAGPCSAETEEQVLTIAHALKNSDVSVFRAGIWKPRTRPGGFEGVGVIGLKWLQRAKAETGLPMAIEVANRNHVELALEHDIDVLWIGARTTVNPFAVQEIADALRGTNKTVLLKNPVNPDLSLWIGGLERLHQANIANLGVIHRGFSTYEKTKYRNQPEWHIAIEFKQKFPEVPMIIDPSHITGKRDMVFQVAQEALDLNYDGMIVETHHSPDKAWSDAAQQVTPEYLKQMFVDWRVRKPDDEAEDFQIAMHQLRKKIDEMDSRLLEVLGKRMEVAEEIGKLKKAKNVSVLQSKRWQEVLDKMTQEGAEKGLGQEFILSIFRAIHQESIAHQEKIILKK
jgi:chorismate mutase